MNWYKKAAQSPNFGISTYEDEPPSISGPDEDSGEMSWLIGESGNNQAYTGDEREVASGSPNIVEYRGQYGSIRYLFIEGGKPIGGVQLVPQDKNVILSNIYVSPDYRRRGVATKLIEHAKKKNKHLTVSPYFSHAGGKLMGF
jgi:GNAT superfamily N-acetyltransferase